MTPMERAKMYLDTAPDHQWHQREDGSYFCSECGARSTFIPPGAYYYQTRCRGGGPPRNVNDLCIHIPNVNIDGCDACMTAFFAGEWTDPLPHPNGIWRSRQYYKGWPACPPPTS